MSDIAAPGADRRGDNLDAALGCFIEKACAEAASTALRGVGHA